jgi:hypothetical protein
MPELSQDLKDIINKIVALAAQDDVILIYMMQQLHDALPPAKYRGETALRSRHGLALAPRER